MPIFWCIWNISGQIGNNLAIILQTPHEKMLGHEEIRSKRILNCQGWKSNISHLFLYLWNEENLYLSQPEFDRIKFDLGKEQIVLIRGLLENISFGLIIWHPHHTSCKFSTHQQSLSPNDNNNKTPTAYRILRHKVVESWKVWTKIWFV